MEKFSITTLANNDGCFDLQFRKDTRHERTGSPTYYRWKMQFIITLPKDQIKVLQKVKKAMGCGDCSVASGQARYAVQKIDDINQAVIPYFAKNRLAGNKKQNFDLWQKAAQTIGKNKGVPLSAWKKHDLLQLMEIHKTMSKYKQKPRKQKWHEMAQVLVKKQTA